MTSRHSSHAVVGGTGGGSSPSNGSSRKHNLPSSTSKPPSSPKHFTLTQAALLAALCSCLSIVLTEFVHTALSASQANHHDQFGYSLILAADNNFRNSHLQQRRVSNISTVRSRESVQEVQISVTRQEGNAAAAVEGRDDKEPETDDDEEEETADSENDEEADEEEAEETKEDGEEEEEEADSELIKVAGEEQVDTSAIGVDPLSVKVVGLKSEDRTVIKADQLKKLSLRNETVDPEIKVVRGNITHPNIAWLMSFPNR